MQRAEKREREKRGGAAAWTPRWFRPVAAPTLVEGEASAERVPFWEWNGEYAKAPARPLGASPDDTDGKGFNPWQFPEIHDKL